MAERVKEHRGFMLDVSRHFMPAEDIWKILLAARECGMNCMHRHLTDDQGWRIEIRKYPKLTEIGGRRGKSEFGGVSATENNSGFYSQEEIRDLVLFAAEIGIEILPEIEIPGHAGTNAPGGPGLRGRPAAVAGAGNRGIPGRAGKTDCRLERRDCGRCCRRRPPCSGP